LKGTWDSERDPLVALRAGDNSLFEAFVAKETRTFLGFFRRLGVSHSEAEDLVQDLFLKLFRHAANYQPSGRFQAFAFRIARNAWIDRSRRAALRPKSIDATDDDGKSYAGLELLASEPGPHEVVERREEVGRVEGALVHLSDGQRLVFELGVVQELPYNEIARILEIPEGTVKSRMFHALRKLKSVLQEPVADAEQEPESGQQGFASSKWREGQA
jgi:RNA polymerase sigma-70 factor (ECF subfamily)